MVDCFFEIQIIGAKYRKSRIQYGSVGSFYLPHGHYQPSYEGQYLCQAEAAGGSTRKQPRGPSPRKKLRGDGTFLLRLDRAKATTGRGRTEPSELEGDLEEFTHKCWGAHQPYTHINGSIPIDGGYKSPEIEVLNVCMLPFLDSPGDHRAFIIDISTRSLLGEFRYKVCRPISRRLITSQQRSVDVYNRIVNEQFDRHRIVIRLDAVDKMTRYCGFPTPNFLRAMIIISRETGKV